MSKTMLYKKGGSVNIWGHKLHIKTVDDEDIDSHLADGWEKHPYDIYDDEELPEIDPDIPLDELESDTPVIDAAAEALVEPKGKKK